MTCEFEYLMRLISVSALGLPLQPPPEHLSWPKLFRLASEQTVFAFAAASSKPFWNDFDDALTKNVRQRLYSIILAGNNRWNALCLLLRRLEEAQIPFALLKGNTLSPLYKTPELRESADVDLYTGEAYEDQAIALLVSQGVSLVRRNPAQHESAGRHPVIGAIELHAHLFRDEDRKVWFGRSASYSEKLAPFQTLEMEDAAVPVLSVQDNAVFLSLHLIKHFIREGITLRNILDLGLFMHHNSTAIDFPELWLLLESLQYDGIIQAVLNVCVQYFDMPETHFPGYTPLPQNTVQAFLEDVEKGGVFGRNDAASRRESAAIYEKQMYASKAQAPSQILWKKRRIFWERAYAVLFNRDKLRQRFPYARKHPWLLPAAWVHHLCRSIRTLIRLSFGQKQGSLPPMPSSQERLRLFQALRIID